MNLTDKKSSHYLSDIQKRPGWNWVNLGTENVIALYKRVSFVFSLRLILIFPHRLTQLLLRFNSFSTFIAASFVAIS